MMGWDGMRISQMSFVSCKKSPEFIRFPWLGGLVDDFHGLVDDFHGLVNDFHGLVDVFCLGRTMNCCLGSLFL